MAGEVEKLTNLTKFYTLMLLNEEPRHGYEIIEELGKKLGKKPSPGQIYPLLKKFRKSKLISQKIVKVGEKRRKVYTLTAEGRTAADRMLANFSDIVSAILEPKLTKCAHCGCKVYEGGHRERIGGKLLMFCCVHCAGSYKRSLETASKVEQATEN